MNTVETALKQNQTLDYYVDTKSPLTLDRSTIGPIIVVLRFDQLEIR